MNLITVKAQKGLVMHFPHSVATAPGAATLVIQGDETAEVDADNRFVRRRLKVGDIEVVSTKTTSNKKTTKAPKE